jgi:microcin C transport system substrate-binding protein
MTRRRAIQVGAGVFGASVLSGLPFGAGAAENETESHGISSFGELQLPPDFKHFGYVSPGATKGGRLLLQIRQVSGNQNYETFDTLNIYTSKGNGAAGLEATFDSLMARNDDEPDALYGLVARAVSVSSDKLTYRFFIRNEARFNDGSRLTAGDVVYSLNTLRSRGHPLYRTALVDVSSVEAAGEDVCIVRFDSNRSRDVHLIVARMPIFSQAYFATRDFEAGAVEPPLGSGPYRVAHFEPGRFIEFELVSDYWAAQLPVRVGFNNFHRIRYEYFRERESAFEAFKSGTLNYREENGAGAWATQYGFPAFRDGRVKREEFPRHDAVPTQGWYFNLRRAKFSDVRVREAINCCFDFEWTNKNIMYSAYRRLQSYFQNSEMEAKAKPAGGELALLKSLAGPLPESVFDVPWIPPTSDGSGSDRNLLRKANELLRAAGYRPTTSGIISPDGSPFAIEFLDTASGMQPHTEAFIANLKKIGIVASRRVVDPVQFRYRLDHFDFDLVTSWLPGSTTPGGELKDVYGSKAAAMHGSRNISGISDPVVDELLDRIVLAVTRHELNILCRILDRVLRTGRYYVPMWFSEKARIAFWDVFARPDRPPRFAGGGPETWWWAGENAKKTGDYK